MHSGILWHWPHATLITAGQQILSGDLHGDLSTALDAYSVRNSLSRPKGLQNISTRLAGLTISSICIWFVFEDSVNRETSIKRNAFHHHDLLCLVLCLTQQEPHEPWSLICAIVGQLGHCWRESKLSGSRTPSVWWTLNKRRRSLRNKIRPTCRLSPV